MHTARDGTRNATGAPTRAAPLETNVGEHGRTGLAAPRAAPVLLYDGSCGLCARSVQFVLAHERERHVLRFATLQGPLGQQALGSVPSLAGVDSVVWLEPPPLDAAPGTPPRVLVRSEAVLAVLDYLGGPWHTLARLGRITPRISRDALYRVVARYRYRVFGRDAACLLPTPEQRARFIG